LEAIRLPMKKKEKRGERVPSSSDQAPLKEREGEREVAAMPKQVRTKGEKKRGREGG